jgi:hypothetical protein
MNTNEETAAVLVYTDSISRSGTPAGPNSKKMVWAGRIVSGLTVVFLLLDAVMKVIKARFVVEATMQIGYPESVIAGIGVVLLVCTLLYVIPRTSVLGAILLTGYLGGAVATHLRVGDPLFSHVLFPVYVGIMVWGGVFLRDERVRALIPLQS